MATVLTDSTNYENIADAIRNQNGTDETYYPSAMAAAISELSPPTAVLYTAQTLTDEQKAQARTNIDAASVNANGTVTSGNADYAEVGEWADGNINDEDRIGYFVAIDTSSAGTTMVKATSTADVRGVTVTSPAFCGNCASSKFDSNGNLLKQYDYVAVMGIVSIIDNGTCTINERCMPSDDGTAIPSNNNMGYHVIDRIDSTHILIAVEPGADMLNRIKNDALELHEHTEDTSIHVTATEKNTWNAKQDKLTGSTGQVVGFDESGSPVAQDVPSPSTIMEQNKGLAQKFWRGTKAEFEAVDVKSDDTMYIITDDEGVPEVPGDMLASVYDIENKQTDIFKYAENLANSKQDTLPDGTDGHILTKDSTTEGGVKWAPAPENGYSKEDSISVSTRTALGLSETATPDDALSTIAQQLSEKAIEFNTWDDSDGTQFESFLDSLYDGTAKIIRLQSVCDYPALIVSGNGGYADVSFNGSGDILVFWHGYHDVLLTGDTGTSYIAVKKKGREKGWSPWEYLNPPMQLGVEYRTTERYLGKPVYAKAVYCGSLPATAGGTTITNTGIDLSEIDMRLTCIGCMYIPDSRSDKRSLPHNDGSILVSINHSKTGRDSEGTAQDSITIYTNCAGLSGYTAYALIKYTKYDK